MLGFATSRGVVSVAAFLSQVLIAVRLGQQEIVAYAAACAVLLLTAEAQTLAGNLEVLAKRHTGITLSNVISNRFYFNLCCAAPTLWLARNIWAGRLESRHVLCGCAAVVLSSFFPGSYGNANSLRTGFRTEAIIGVLCFTLRLFATPSLESYWVLFCLEIAGRSLVGITFAVRAHRTRIVLSPDLRCVRVALLYGVILLFQMAFQRLEIALLPRVAAPHFMIVAWTAGGTMIFALNAVFYQALVGYRVVGTTRFARSNGRPPYAVISGVLTICVTAFSWVLSARKTAPTDGDTIYIVVLCVYFFVIAFENFSYIEFFFAVGATRTLLIVCAGRVAVALVFAAMVVSGVPGVICLAALLVGKSAASAAEIALTARDRVHEVRNGDPGQQHARIPAVLSANTEPNESAEVLG